MNSVRLDFLEGKIKLQIEGLLPADLESVLQKALSQGEISEDQFFPLHRLFKDREIQMVLTPAFQEYLEALKKRYGVHICLKKEAGKKRLGVEMAPDLSPDIQKILQREITPWGTLKKISRIGNLLRKLEGRGAYLTFTQEAKNYLDYFRRRNTVHFVFQDGGIGVKEPEVLFPKLFSILHPFLKDGQLEDPLMLPRLVKRLKEKGKEGWVEVDPMAGRVYTVFARNHCSILPSSDFYQHIEVVFDEKYLQDSFKRILTPFVDVYHLLKDYREVEPLVEELKSAGCSVKLYPETYEVVRLQARIAGADLPDFLSYPLYEYEKKGSVFLAVQGNALLADEMGLGKTVQAIAAFKLLKSEGKVQNALVIVPASLKLQWAREIEKFTQEPYRVISGTKEERIQQYTRNSVSFYILNYELLLRDFEEIRKLNTDLVILDEAQRIKNYQTKTHQLIRLLPRKYAFALTGTPLENQLMELYTVMRFLNPDVLGRNVQTFMRRYCIKNHFGAVVGYRRVEEVRKKVSAVILRRTKQEVLSQLPERVENTYSVPLTPAQEKLYHQYRQPLLELLKKKEEWKERDLHEAFGQMTYLLEICDSAELVSETEKASSKLEELKPILEEILSGDHKILLFSQWERMTAILQREIEKMNVKTVRFYGDLTMKQRQEVIDAFTNLGDIRVFISTDAGALGVNLQVADFVVNFDLPWNPAKLEQRIARAHRIGQKRTVNVVNLITQRTLESGILKVLYKKRRLFKEIFDYLETERMLSSAPAARQMIAQILQGESGD